MALACKHLDQCHWCPHRAPRQQCWWIINDAGPWRLCAACLAHAEALA